MVLSVQHPPCILFLTVLFFIYRNIYACDPLGHVESDAHDLRRRGRLGKPVVPQQKQNTTGKADSYT